MTMSGHHGDNSTVTDKRRHYDKDSDGGGARHNNNNNNKYDDPPNSRLFIVCGKQIAEEQFRDAFDAFGNIEEIRVLKDRVTGEPKGVTYIKFSKTSEAALAMEEMNGRCIDGSPRPLKVLIAHSKDQGSRRDMNEDERLVRLFVVVGKMISEAELKEHFSQFGDIDYVSIVRDRNTKESKGFAYVKYHRMSHAAKAYEECDRNFKPVFADPKPNKSLYHDGSGNSGGGDRFGGPGSTTSSSTTASMSASYDLLSHMDSTQSNPEGICRLSVSASTSVNQDQIWRLFDLVPGLDFCDRARDIRSVGRSKGIFTVVYNNPQSACYAKEKLHGFEYPPGYRLVVRFDSTLLMSPGNFISHRPNLLQGTGPTGTSVRPNIQNDLAHLTETIANATALLQAAGYSASNNSPSAGQTLPTSQPTPATTNGETYDPAYCSVKLPAPQPLAAMESEVAERLFIVCTPVPPQMYVLKDVFGRFGNLIDIYILHGKTCGYAKYASKNSADRAVSNLHGQEVCGSRLKVMPADPQEKAGESGRKRPKFSSEGDS